MLSKTNKMSINDEFVPVHSLWICRDMKIIAESQMGSEKQNNKERNFVNKFITQVIEPSKKSKLNKNEALDSAFTIYIKKRKYLFHVLYDGELTFLSLTMNTLRQQPLHEIFNLLYTMQSSLIFEGGLSFTDSLSDLHDSYVRNSSRGSKIHKNTFSPTYSNDHQLNFDYSDGSSNHEPFYSFSSKRHNSNTLQTATHLSPTASVFSPVSGTRSRITSASKSGFSLKSYLSDTEDEKLPCDMQYFILKKGWMTKMGETFKTWKCRYFELWSNGLLNYFENELKIKKKGSLNISDEVISAQLYVRQHTNSKQNNDKPEYGFTLISNHRTWCFIVNKERVRDDWFLLIQLITFGKMDIHLQLNALKVRLDKLHHLWQSEFKHIEHEILNGNEDHCNIYQLQYDLKTANDICNKCKKEVSLFCGSDIFSMYSPKIEDIAENMERVQSLIDGIIHSRNETPFKDRKRCNTYLSKKKENLYKKLNKKIMQKDKDGALIKDQLKMRLPSKKLLTAKNALSKKIRVLQVEVQETFFKVNIERANAAPLLWKFDEIIKIGDIKGVYFGKRKKGTISLKDIQQFQITIFHLSNRRLQFIFDNEKEAYLWFKTLSSLFYKCNPMNTVTQMMQYKPNFVSHQKQLSHKQIGL